MPCLLFPRAGSDADRPAESGARPDKDLAATAHLGLCGRRPRHFDILRPSNPIIYTGPANMAGAGCRKHAQRMKNPPDGAQPPFDPPVHWKSGCRRLSPERDDDFCAGNGNESRPNERDANQGDVKDTPLQGARREKCVRKSRCSIDIRGARAKVPFWRKLTLLQKGDHDPRQAFIYVPLLRHGAGAVRWK